MQLVTLYAFDPTGRATANKIENQSITVIPPTEITDYSYVIPRGAPFYSDSLVVKDGTGPGARTLVENVDYWCVIDFLSASISLTSRVSVGIALLDPGYSGTLYITYQAVGGNYSLADYSVLEELIRERYIVKHISYEQLIHLPEGFAPDWHTHEIGDMVGMSEVVQKLAEIKTAIEGRQGSYGQLSSQISNHLNSNTAHTPSQVGLSNLKNYGVATLTEATSGSTNKYITADTLKSYVSQVTQTGSNSPYLTINNAETFYVTKQSLLSYSTTLQSDSKYALKNDTYTKLQIDTMVSGSGGSSDAYSKVQSDARYSTKSDMSEYVKTEAANIRYATKTDLNYHYTKAQSDGKYATTTAVANCLTINSNAYGRVETLESDTSSTGFTITLTDTNPSGNKTLTTNLDLTGYQKTNNGVTRDDVISAYLYTLEEQFKWYQLNCSNLVVYRGYQLNTNWTVKACRFMRRIIIQVHVLTSFYLNEDVIITLELNSTSALPANGNDVVNLKYMAFNCDALAFNTNQDYWIRPTTVHATLEKAAARLRMPMRFSLDGQGTDAVSGLLTTVELDCPTDVDFDSILTLLARNGTVITEDMITPAHTTQLTTHLGW